jgi:hypothetical protein
MSLIALHLLFQPPSASPLPLTPVTCTRTPTTATTTARTTRHRRPRRPDTVTDTDTGEEQPELDQEDTTSHMRSQQGPQQLQAGRGRHETNMSTETFKFLYFLYYNKSTLGMFRVGIYQYLRVKARVRGRLLKYDSRMNRRTISCISDGNTILCTVRK